MAISVTFLSSYLYCQRKLFIERVLGIKPPVPKEAIIRGSIRHSVYEQVNIAAEEIIKSIDEKEFSAIYELYKNRYMKILKQTIVFNKEKLKSIEIPLSAFFAELKPAIENEAKYRARKVFEFIEKTGLLGPELWENITPKIKPEYRLVSEELGLKGIVDELEVYKDFFVPVELKTGKTPLEGVWPGHKIQVGAYALLIETAFGVSIEKGIVRYLDTNTEREVVINPFLKHEVKELINRVEALLDSSKIPGFSSNENKCNSCDLRGVCFDKNALKEKLESKIPNS